MINSLLLLLAVLSWLDGVFPPNLSEQLGHLLPIVLVMMTAVCLDEISLFVWRKANR